MRQRIYETKIKFFDFVRKLPSSRISYQALCENLNGGWDSDYIREITNIELETGILLLEGPDRLQQIDKWGKKRIRDEIKQKKSLCALPYPVKGWKRANHVTDEEWSKVLSQFRAGNAMLGNRDTLFQELVPDCCDSKGLLKICPACLTGKLSEVHVILECPALHKERSTLLINKSLTLENYVAAKSRKGFSTEEIMRDLLDVTKLSINSMQTLSNLLDKMRSSFFSKWITE